ncbi:basic-leucine zipper transcription factor family protein [Striga asiatica]|uniref:Basic-leucine zipper transcription factor family protein n=1 Tax=Striga asiatica TaxID=4170 RepID=A0A5A7QC04_STRAF|nr:basic-leucine zipper transcription factor family protein [Striga asiatica]
MSSKPQPASSSSDLDERKRKRKLSNRESARRSRMKKQQRLDELVAQVGQLQEENKKVMQMIDGATQLYINFSSDNNVMRAQVSELTGRLHSLNSVIQIASEVSGLAFEVPDIPDILLEPWQMPCRVQPIPANVDIFKF